MQRLTRTLAMASALAFAGVLAGCGDDVTVSQPTTVTVTPPSASVAVGGAVTFTASVTGDIANKTVTWASSDASKATVDANGKVVGVAVGNSTITATSAGDANAKASALVTVTAVSKGVTKVEVSPNNQIIKIGDFIQLTANVSRDPGVAGTVTWTSSAAAVATVDASGKVTGVTNGSAVITAASTVDPSVTGTMALTVRPTTPAQISIQKITTGNTNTPVNFNNVAGQIDVTLNLNPGDQTVTKVEVLLDGATACSQNLSVGESQALSQAAVFSDVQAVDIVCSINTAEFNATTGAAKYLNGVRQITAKATIGGSQPGNIATPSQALTFNNVNTLVATQTFGGTTATATSAAGFAYRRGSLTVSVLPVVYNNGQAVAAGVITFGGCSAGGARQAALTAPVAGSGAWTATFAQTAAGGAAATNVVDYEFDPTLSLACGAALATGETFSITATDNAGNALYAAAVPANAAALNIRLDNKAPAAPAVSINPNGRLNGWLNDAASFVTLQAAATPDGMIAAAITDAGVGSVSYAAKAAGTLATAIAAADITTPSSLAPTLAPTDLCLVQYAQDKLGNRSADPVACATNFGVDRAAPTIAFSGGVASNSRFNTATLAGQFQVTVSDTGSIGNSGTFSANSVLGTVTLRGVGITGAATCVVGTWVAATTTCTPTSVNAAPAFPLVPTTMAGPTGNGYYTYNAVARDAAGNSTAPVSRVTLLDNAAPVLSSASFPLPFTPAAPALTSASSDNLDIRSYQWYFNYGTAMGGFPIETPSVAVNGYNANPFINSNVPVLFNTGLLGQIQDVGTAWTAPAAAQVVTAANATVLDQGNNTVTTTTPIPAVAITAPFTNANGTSWGITTAAATTNVSDGNVTAPVVTANPLSIALRADATGATAVFNPTITRVDFYAMNSAGTRWVFIGSATGPATTDNGAVRLQRYSFTWTPGTAFGVGARNVRAVAVNGTAGYSTADFVVTITNP
jgi:hypothetical protein